MYLILPSSSKSSGPRVSKSIVKVLSRDSQGKRPRGYVCLLSDIPSLLLEPMFFNNPKHHTAIVKDDICFTIGKSIAEAIVEWDLSR